MKPLFPRHLVLRRFSWLLGAHVWRGLLQTLFLLWLARRDTTAYGEFMLALQCGTLLLFVAEAGLNPYLVEHLAREPRRQRAWLRGLALMRTGLLLLGSAGVWLFARAQGYPLRLQGLALGLGGAIGLEAVAGTFFAGLQVAGRQSVEGRIRGWAATLGWGYGLAALAAGWGVLRLSLGKWLETLVNLAGAARAAWVAAPPAEPGAARALPPWAWREGLLFTWLAVAALLFNKANVFFLQRWGGSDAVAQYSATWQVVDGLPILVSNLLLARVLYPLFTLQWAAHRPELAALAQQTARWLALAGLAAVLALGLGSAPLIRLLYGPAYEAAIRWQPVLAWTIPCALLHNTAAYLLLAAGRRRFLALAYGGALLLNLWLCHHGIPAAPLAGAVWAMVITKACLAATTVAAASCLLPLWRPATLAALGGAGLAGWLLHRVTAPAWGVGALVPALLPAAGLAWHWWREPGRPRRPGSIPPASESCG